MIVLAAALSTATAGAGRAALTTSLVCISRTLSLPVAAQGPDSALPSPELCPDKCSCATAVNLPPPELRNQAHRAGSNPPSTARERPPLNPEGFGWVPTASAGVQKRLVSYRNTNHKN